MRVLVTAASRHGATAEIADAIGDELRGRRIDVDVVAPGDVGEIDGYDAIVLGSAVYAGHWLAPARDLARRWVGSVADRPVWLFSSGPVGDPSRKMVRRMSEDPLELAEIRGITGARDHRMFAGRLERTHLSIPEKGVLLVLRGLEGDFRDWAAIRAWASQIAVELRPAA
jgi:menaquinone-dependent protoporphyrinogen oxidase